MARFSIEACTTIRSPGRLIRRINKLTTALICDRFEEHGLSFQHWIALKAVRDGTVTNAGELARELDITSGATTRLIDTLESRGHLERDRGHADRRVVRLAVTQRGLDVIVALAPHVLAIWNEVAEDFSFEEMETFTVMLERLTAGAERATARHDAFKEAAE